MELDFRVDGAEAVRSAAQPLLALKLHITADVAVRGMLLTAQIRIASPQRAYSSAEQAHLADIFGPPGQWGQTLKPLLWTIASVNVGPFHNETSVDVPIACTYDFEVVSAKYLHALEQDGGVPLELLFSGTVFYAADNGQGLQVEQIAWDKEARFRLPVQVWRDVMQSYFPNTAWVRLRQDTFDRLHMYRMRQGLPTWDAALEQLLTANVWTR